MAATRISPKRQITIPMEVFKALQLDIGDYLEAEVKDGVMILTPKKLIPKDQAWFWTKEWQEKEKKAEADIQAGRVKEFKNVEKLIKDLNS